MYDTAEGYAKMTAKLKFCSVYLCLVSLIYEAQVVTHCNTESDDSALFIVLKNLRLTPAAKIPLHLGVNVHPTQCANLIPLGREA